MPWMRKYRVFSQVRLKQSMEALAINKLIAAEDAKSLATRFGEDMDNLKGNLLGAATTATDGLLNAGAAAVEDVKGLATGS